jgi:hypothetical protein
LDAYSVRNICSILQRVVPLLRALETAAAVDGDAAALWADLRQQRRTGTASIAADLAGKAALRCSEKPSRACCLHFRRMRSTD